MANALNRQEGLDPRLFTAARVRRDAFGRRRAFRALVAQSHGRVVGYASFVAGYNSDIAARQLWMLDLFVLPAWRRYGTGRALLAAVAAETVRRGLRCLEWGVRAGNARARRFYRGLGARESRNLSVSLQGRALAQVAARRR